MNPRSLSRHDASRFPGLLNEEQPRNTAGFDLPTERAEPESLVEEYLRTFSRHRRLIVLCVLGGLVLALAANIHTLPLYRTRTSIDIRSLNGDFMDMRTVAPTGSGSSDEISTNLQTQIKLLLSDTLLDQVRAQLLSEPHPATIERNDLLSRMERGLHLGGDGTVTYKDMVDDATQRVKVKPLGLTRLVEVTCESWDPDFSAAFCNTLTRTFEEQDLKTRALEAQKTQTWLTKQVADVRDRAEESQKKLEQAVGGNGLMLSQTTTTAGEDRLRSLQDELVKAQADRMQKQALASVASTASAETLPGVQDDPTHRAYEAKLADLRSQLSQLVPTLTEQNPKVIKLRAQIADAEAGLRATATSSTTRQMNEFSAARHREELLDVAFKAQEAAVSSDLQKASQVSLLRREVESEQQLYQTLLQRAKEAGFAAAMQAATIRVIDAARPPHFAASPRLPLAGGIGLVLGGIFGLGLSLYKDRNNKVLRVPGDVERFLHVRELGVIPANRHIAAPSTSLASLRVRDKSATETIGGPAIASTRWNDNFSLAAEAYRNATLSILLSDVSKRSRSYVVSSPSVGEGKTTITSNLGVALSKAKLRVVLIDGDLRRPNLHNAFAVSNDFGLRDILRGELDLNAMPTELLTHRVGLPNIALIPAGEGKEDVVELLHSPHLPVLLERLARDFDVILIDSPPILHMADARILAGHSDGGILVLRAGMTSRDQATVARDVFHHDGVLLIGTILNDFNPNSEGKGDYYKSYYRYGGMHEPQNVGTGV